MAIISGLLGTVVPPCVYLTACVAERDFLIQIYERRLLEAFRVVYITIMRENCYMRFSLAIVGISILIMLAPVLASAQNNQAFDVLKAKGSENFAVSYQATNTNIKQPFVYTYDPPKAPNWILSIRNNLSYTAEPGVKTVIKIQEPAPSQKYIEVIMFGDKSRKFLVSVNTPDTGYYRIYDGNLGGWSTENPITVEHHTNGGLSVSDGKRNVVDELNLQGFTASSIVVYGNDDAGSTFQNANGGNISFQILYGDFKDSPLYIVPAAIMIGVGGLIGGLLIFKKRSPN